MRTSASAFRGPVLAGERIVLRLRPTVSHAAHAERERALATSGLGEARVPALDALVVRLAGARLEPEFLKVAKAQQQLGVVAPQLVQMVGE